MAVSPDTRDRNELTVGQVTRHIKRLLEGSDELRDIWIRGEASNVRLAGSGHLYFTLKDQEAQVRVAYFRYGNRRKPPADGEELLVHGDIRVYEVRGEYQLVANDLVKAGQGDLAAKFEALKRKLHEEGLFDESRKVPVPVVPRRIAIVTGIATAALQDVLNVLRRRTPYLNAVVFPASVQGDQAPPEIISALRAADECPGIETILLVRGGGSLEDLWCFNDEGLARVLAEVKRPVITGVGHEIDFTIVDFIADRRAPTPSAAAELCAPDVTELRGGIENSTYNMLRNVLGTIDTHNNNLTRLFDRRLIRDVVGTIEDHTQSIDSLAGDLAELAARATHLDDELSMAAVLEQLALPVTRRLDGLNHRLPLETDSLLRAGRLGLESWKSNVKTRSQELNSRDPRAPKKLGFALVWDKDGKIVRKADDVAVGDKLRVELGEGELPVKRSE